MPELPAVLRIACPVCGRYLATLRAEAATIELPRCAGARGRPCGTQTTIRIARRGNHLTDNYGGSTMDYETKP